MMILLVAILVVALTSMIFNVAYIIHELGWFPHGKRRDQPTRGLVPLAYGYPADGEVNFTTDSSFAMTLRRYGHPDTYDFDDPVAQLRSALDRYKDEASYSRLDDLIQLMNVVSKDESAPNAIDEIAEEAIQAVAEREGGSSGEVRS